MCYILRFKQLLKLKAYIVKTSTFSFTDYERINCQCGTSAYLRQHYNFPLKSFSVFMVHMKKPTRLLSINSKQTTMGTSCSLRRENSIQRKKNRTKTVNR